MTAAEPRVWGLDDDALAAYPTVYRSDGTWHMMQAAARRWRDQGRPGRIINIVANIHRGTLQTTHSAAARAGIVYLGRSLAVKWAPLGITGETLSVDGGYRMLGEAWVAGEPEYFRTGRGARGSGESTDTE